MNDEISNQQGDVILRKVEGVKGKKLNHLVLAKGEHTGHKHQIIQGDAELYEDDGSLSLHVTTEDEFLVEETKFPNVKYLENGEEKILPKGYGKAKFRGALLNHEEHFAQVVEKGHYKIGIVQEYDHFAEEARNVAD